MDNPLVSIIMPVYNAAATLPQALRSLGWQSYENWELILIDDGSIDRTLLLAREIAQSDARIQVTEGASNAGLASRLNQAIGMARGHFIARMDADDLAYPARLAAQVKFMIDYPECDLVGCAALIFDDAGQVQGKFPLRLTHSEICARPWAGFPLPHPTWLGKRAWFARHGYAPDYKKTQDQDLLLRSYAESRFACVPEILLGYRQERRTLKKLIAGRRNFARSIVRESLRQGAYAAGAAGLAGQIVKGAIDALTVPAGWDRKLRRESSADVSVLEQQAWHAIYSAAMAEDGRI